MVNDLIDGIAAQLQRVWGEECRIYTDQLPQELTVPYFFIQLQDSSRTAVKKGRFYQQNAFEISYFPALAGSNWELNAVAFALYEALALITGDGAHSLIQGTSMHYKNEAGVLRFYAEYNVYLVQADSTELMEDISTCTGLD